jgi:hypothetical protein
MHPTWQSYVRLPAQTIANQASSAIRLKNDGYHRHDKAVTWNTALRVTATLH